MIARRNPTDPRLAELHALLAKLADGLASDDMDQVLACFDERAVLYAPDTARPLEGAGSLRSYFRRHIRAQRFGGPPRLTSIDFREPSWAIVRAECGPGELLTFALTRAHGSWLITHCQWTIQQHDRAGAA